jgi:hypothetical protein
MRSRTLADAARWLLFTAALVAAVALVFGMRPRTLAVEIGPAQAAATLLTTRTDCLLCNGATTAGTLAPAAHTFAMTVATPPRLVPAPRANPVAVEASAAPPSVFSVPDAPPPRV